MAEIRISRLAFSAVSKEHCFVWLICAWAAVHVFIFSAAFPFFNNVDEQYHFDLAVKYSHLEVPTGPEYVSAESLQYMAVFATWEYLYTNDSLRTPPWKQPMSEIGPILIARENRWRLPNTESPQAPLYYLGAGAWWRIWTGLRFHDDSPLYMLRFLNVFFVGALVWLGWHAARLIFPENIFIRIAVPAFLAFMPQTIFYSINNDVLSPLCFGAAFVCVVKWPQTDVLSTRLAAATGLALAAAFLAKTTNLPLLVLSAVFIAAKIWNLIQRGMFRASLSPLVCLFVCAALPATLWIAWCKVHFGVFLGSTETARLLGWTPKPFSQWWHHPIFTPRGFGIFLSGNLATFWQGEMMWHGKPLSLLCANLFFELGTVILIAGALIHLNKAGPGQRFALQFALAGVVMMLALFGFLSVVYDFDDCFYPSREHPYFTSGRLMLGTLIPFLLVVVYGLDRMLNGFGNTAKFVTLVALLLTVLALEVATNWPVFSSQYNWFNIGSQPSA